MDTSRPRVSLTARLLGYSGLLPQMAAVLLTASGGKAGALGYAIVIIYGALILSFLGGIWWGFATRRKAGQGQLASLAVLPSLAAATIILWAGVLGDFTSPEPLIALGATVIATLAVDRHLAATGDAPPDWMRLRAPLSLGLGGLTILAGLLAV